MYTVWRFLKACIGSFGKNCSGGTCTAGFYGHGCGEQCPCGSLMCDPTRGCPKGLSVSLRLSFTASCCRGMSVPPAGTHYFERISKTCTPAMTVKCGRITYSNSLYTYI